VVKIGDKVRVITVPPDLPEGDLASESLFKLCVGHTFPVVGLRWNLLELEVGEIQGKEPYMDSIWIEPENVEIVLSPD